MNAVPSTSALKAAAVKAARSMIASGASEDAVQAEKTAVLDAIYGFLRQLLRRAAAAGSTSSIVDEGRRVPRSKKGYTPTAFAERYVGGLARAAPSRIINAPTAGQAHTTSTYTVSPAGERRRRAAGQVLKPPDERV